MKKSLSERIAENAPQKNLSQRGKNLASILALRNDIKQALNDGWPIKSIWETLKAEKKINSSYETFRLYINRLIKDSLLNTAAMKSDLALTRKPKIKNQPAGEEQTPQIINPAPLYSFSYKLVPNN